MHTVAALQQTSLLSLMRQPLGIGSASLIAMPGMAVHLNGAHVPGENRLKATKLAPLARASCFCGANGR